MDVLLFHVAIAVVLVASGSAQLTDLQQNEILQVHNALRGEVYPSASNMQKLTWNQELADIAQGHSTSCRWAPNAAANQLAARAFPDGIGENMAFSFSSSSTTSTANIQPARFVHEWFAESAFFNFTNNTCAPLETCSHYTQVVQSTTSSLGCGFFTCTQFDFFGMILPNASFFVCHYGPRGGAESVQPYTEGTPCSACPAHLPRCEANLCASNTTTATDAPTTATVDVTTAAKPTVPTLLPSYCDMPRTHSARQGCWREAWLLWTRKYDQWKKGECITPTV